MGDEEQSYYGECVCKQCTHYISSTNKAKLPLICRPVSISISISFCSVLFLNPQYSVICSFILSQTFSSFGVGLSFLVKTAACWWLTRAKSMGCKTKTIRLKRLKGCRAEFGFWILGIILCRVHGYSRQCLWFHQKRCDTFWMQLCNLLRGGRYSCCCFFFIVMHQRQAAQRSS